MRDSDAEPPAPFSLIPPEVQLLFEFDSLFAYEEPNERAIAIVGSAYLDELLRMMLVGFLVDDEKATERLVQPDGALGSFGARTSVCYCLGLIGKTARSDLRLVAKIR